MDRFKTISTFVQIAKSQSLSKAASELGISRALASAHLKQLEQHLGVRLFNRTTRQISLTEAGAEYLSFCNEILAMIEGQESKIATAQNQAAGNLKIMASMAFGNAKLGPLITSFTQHYPSIRVSVILSDRAFSPSDFVEGGYDVGISMNQIKDGSIITTKVADVGWILCTTPSYLEGKQPIETPQDLVNINCLVHRSQAPHSVWRFHGPEGPAEVAVKGTIFTNSALILRAAILTGEGVAMLPLYAVAADLREGRLVQLLKRYSAAKRPIYLVYPHAKYLPRRTRLFVDYFRKAMKASTW